MITTKPEIDTQSGNLLIELRPHHLEDLRNSGLSDETIIACGFYSECDTKTIASIIGGTYAKKRGPALVFPFRDLDGSLNGFKRIKPDCPRVDRNGRPIKYESPRGQGNRAFIPSKTHPVLSDSGVALLVSEGEKKSAKADQEGFPCIGLTGVYGWKHGKHADRLIPDLDAVEWNGRHVTIVYDSDLNEKPEIIEAESRLAAQLANRGAKVKVGRLPDGPDGAKVGLDDFLVAHGRDALYAIIEKAEEPEPVDPGVAKTPARLIDAMVEARRFIKKLATFDGVAGIKTYRGEVWGWDGKKYRAMSKDMVRARVTKFLDHDTSHLTTAAINNVVACVKAETVVADHLEQPLWLGGTPVGQSYISLQNGILDIDAALAGKDGHLLPHSPRWFSSVCLPYELDLKADCPKWLAFLDRNLEDDRERVELLQEFFGLCLVRDTGFHKFLVLEGDGGSGKSTACAVLTALLGKENVSSWKFCTNQ